MKREFISPFGAEVRDRSDRTEYRGGNSHIFLWTVFILLLTGFCLATWIGTFTVFGHPERPFSYRILRKIKKLESPQRFKLNAAPQGEFLTAEKAYARYAAMSDFELRTLNVQLTRDYIRNFQQTTASVPYLTGRFSVMQAFPLQSRDLFPTGAAAVVVSLDNPQFLVEQIYPAEGNTGALIANALVPGVELEMKRTYDLSAITRITRLPDGRLLATVVPLTYGSYTLKTSEVSFSLDPPTELNLSAGWPVLKGDRLEGADKSFLQYRRKANLGPLLARAKDASPPPVAAKAPDLLVSTESSRRTRSAGRAAPTTVNKTATAGDTAKAPATTKSPASATTPVASPANAAQASTTPAALSNLPPGRRVKAAELSTLGDQPFGKDERVYLTGQFFVQAVAEDRAVLVLPGTKPGPKAMRVIAKFPAVKLVPIVGTELARDDSRPFQVTDIRRTNDGSLTVYVNELPR